MRLRIEVKRYDMTSIACFTKERHLQKRVIFKSSHCRRTPIHCLPNTLEKSGETSVCLANINMNILALTGSVSPNRRGRNGFGSKPYACHRCKPDSARNNGILAEES